MKTNIVSIHPATPISSACHKVADKAHTTVDWYTPPVIVKALGGAAGFDLDPCTPEDHTKLPARTAKRMIKPSEDGLATPWPKNAYVWMNPPYGRGIERWTAKLANHPGGGIALVPANMDPAWMHESVLAHPNATAVVFTRGRLKFVRPDGMPGNASPGGSVLVAYGVRAAASLKQALSDKVLRGHYMELDWNYLGSGLMARIPVGVAANDDREAA